MHARRDTRLFRPPVRNHFFSPGEISLCEGAVGLSYNLWMRDENVPVNVSNTWVRPQFCQTWATFVGGALIFSSSDTLRYLARFLSAVVGYVTCTHLQDTAPLLFVSSEGLDAQSSALWLRGCVGGDTAGIGTGTHSFSVSWHLFPVPLGSY